MTPSERAEFERFLRVRAEIARREAAAAPVEPVVVSEADLEAARLDYEAELADGMAAERARDVPQIDPPCPWWIPGPGTM